MKRIIGWFVGNPVAANLLMWILVIGGLISIFQLRQEEMPAIDLGVIDVTVAYLGAAPEEVENGVSLRIEEALEGIQGVDRITSTSSEGRSRVVVEIEEGADRVQGTERSQEPGGCHHHVSGGKRNGPSSRC